MPKFQQSVKPKLLKIGGIKASKSTQSRESISADTVSQYAEAMQAGAEFPPVVVFFDGSNFWLSDGFHRYSAAKKCKRTEIACEVRDGNARDAKIYAACANQSHGLRRTNEDKRKAVGVLLADSEWSKKSDSAIAEATGVSHTFVASLRPQLATNASCRTGRDGRTRNTSSGKRSDAQKARHQSAPAQTNGKAPELPAPVANNPTPPAEWTPPESSPPARAPATKAKPEPPNKIAGIKERLSAAVANELLNADEPGRQVVALVLEELAAELRDRDDQPLLRTLA